MITKELFIKFIQNYQSFDAAIDRISEALIGDNVSVRYSCDLYDSDWVNAVGNMLDSFLVSHFTEAGQDLIYWWFYEQVPKVIYVKHENSFFEEFKDDIEISVETIDELWDYMIKNKKDYFNG